ATVLVGSRGGAGINPPRGAPPAHAGARVPQLAETRSHLAEALNRLWPLREPGDAEALSDRLSQAERAFRNLAQLIAEGRQRQQRLAEAERHRYVTAVTWLTLLTGLGPPLGVAPPLLSH